MELWKEPDGSSCESQWRASCKTTRSSPPVTIVLQIQIWEQSDVQPVLAYDERIVIRTKETGPMRQVSLTWPLGRVYCRYSQIFVKVRLDLYGDGSLCLPLSADGTRPGRATDWTIERKLADRFLMPREGKQG